MSTDVNKLLSERVPLQVRMDSVYNPMIAQDCACFLCEDLIRSLRELKNKSTRSMCRDLDTSIKEYRDGIKGAMKEELFSDLQSRSHIIYDWVRTDLTIYSLQYTQALYNTGVSLEKDTLRVVSNAYVIRQILNYVIQTDRDYTERIKSYLPADVSYITEDNRYCLRMVEALRKLLAVYGVPDSLESVQIHMSYQVFKNMLGRYHITCSIQELSEVAKRRYGNGYCRCADCSWEALIKKGECSTGQRIVNTIGKRTCWRKCNLFKLR